MRYVRLTTATPSTRCTFFVTILPGARKDAAFSPAEVKRLAKFQVLAIEKWYTACGSKGPAQSGPDCAVEEKMSALFKQTKVIRRNAMLRPYIAAVLIRGRAPTITLHLRRPSYIISSFPAGLLTRAMPYCACLPCTLAQMCAGNLPEPDYNYVLELGA